jgi:hypothetical protein
MARGDRFDTSDSLFKHAIDEQDPPFDKEALQAFFDHEGLLYEFVCLRVAEDFWSKVALVAGAVPLLNIDADK